MARQVSGPGAPSTVRPSLACTALMSSWMFMGHLHRDDTTTRPAAQWIRARPRASTRRASFVPASPARREHLGQLVRGRHLQLVVAAILRRLVGAPAQEHRGVAEAVALEVVVLDLAHALRPQRLPAQVL